MKFVAFFCGVFMIVFMMTALALIVYGAFGYYDAETSKIIVGATAGSLGASAGSFFLFSFVVGRIEDAESLAKREETK